MASSTGQDEVIARMERLMARLQRRKGVRRITVEASSLTGARMLAEAVRPTLGPESRSVLIERKYGQPLVSR